MPRACEWKSTHCLARSEKITPNTCAARNGWFREFIEPLTRMKALLIDDERLARNELRRLLAAFPDITIIGEAANAKQAREQLAATKPDLLFLDVQMPGETG